MIRPASAAILALSLTACAAPTPPLLAGPPGPATIARTICPDGPIPVRMEFAERLTRRLEQRFPPGSDEASLVGLLTAQGFELGTACRDRSVRTAAYESARGDTAAVVYWQADADRRMLWIGATVSYTPL